MRIEKKQKKERKLIAQWRAIFYLTKEAVKEEWLSHFGVTRDYTSSSQISALLSLA